MILKLLTGPLIGMIIGYFTNWLAVRMLFRPRGTKYIAGKRIPFTPGVIPRGKERIAASMKDIINTINTAGAYRTILAELHLNDSDVEFSSITMHDGLYEANLFTAWMHYECYVDAATSEVLGLNAEPMLLYSTDKHDGKFEHLSSTLRHSA